MDRRNFFQRCLGFGLGLLGVKALPESEVSTGLTIEKLILARQALLELESEDEEIFHYCFDFDNGESYCIVYCDGEIINFTEFDVDV